MTWAQTAKRYLAIFDTVATANRASRRVPIEIASARKEDAPLPDVRLGHVLSMCDDTGLLQHAVHSVPDRHHGYCVDDNARALLLSCALQRAGGPRFSETQTGRFAAFVQHAWNPDTHRFRNFMSFDRTWLESAGSEDSHGRALWALATCMARDISPARQRWAAKLFKTALPAVASFRSPRAWAFTLLGLDEYCAIAPEDPVAREMRDQLAQRLRSLLAATQTDGWRWFEGSLAYDNARLPQALIVTGVATRNPSMLNAALESLSWLVTVQTTPHGRFRPVGTESYGRERRPALPFDQQPLEATATIAACLAAWRARGAAEWLAQARSAFAWFVGDNDLDVPLIDRASGSCRDGLHADRANENCGAESVLSYLLGLLEMRELGTLAATMPRTQRSLQLAFGA